MFTFTLLSRAFVNVRWDVKLLWSIIQRNITVYYSSHSRRYSTYKAGTGTGNLHLFKLE
jgi:hypothetical protein